MFLINVLNVMMHFILLTEIDYIASIILRKNHHRVNQSTSNLFF